jgi:SAM-dependent methyltransferase
MSEHQSGQVAASAAEIYDRFFVPAVFIDWPPRLLAATGVQPGDRVLDVACGTGVVALEALRIVGDRGAVIGVDINDGMLSVARAKSAAVTWQKGAAETLPFANDSFDRVVCQFGLMFFTDRVKAITEMQRVLRPGGRAGIAVWAPLADTPGYAAVADMLRGLFGAEVAMSIEVPYCLGDADVLRALLIEAGAVDVRLQTVAGKVRFASLQSWLHTDIKGWTLADVIDDAGYARLQAEAPKRLAQFVLRDGSVEFAAPARIATFAAANA